ncbi:hypothetical protein PRK78_001240 [Emydomyces testavorans]|uniref:Uncharacterized protein n=1 Tax=Emydomyces testavorans TaxID=2070801 RepID=A0AAF0DE05_9EURO|nr:hypothetical protein PRK78_001240 [Emydomyces testavorans]
MRFSLVSVLALSAVALGASSSTSGSQQTAITLNDPTVSRSSSGGPSSETGSMTILPVPTMTGSPSGTSGPGSNSTATRPTRTDSRTVSGPTGSRPTTASSAGLAPTNGPQAVGFGLGLGALVAALL